MAEPKKETVPISLRPRLEQPGSALEVTKPDPARIVPPTRMPMTPIRRLPPKIAPHLVEPTADTGAVAPAGASPILQPMPKPPGLQEGPKSTIALPGDRGLKQETARISILPRPAPVAPPAINITKTQPLLAQPAAPARVAPVVLTSRPLAPLEIIPRPLCWALVGVSGVIFLIQIWNYVVS
jgi:hypothetical protein